MPLNVQNVEKQQVETRNFAMDAVSHSTWHAPHVMSPGDLCSITSFAPTVGIV